MGREGGRERERGWGGRGGSEREMVGREGGEKREREGGGEGNGRREGEREGVWRQRRGVVDWALKTNYLSTFSE